MKKALFTLILLLLGGEIFAASPVSVTSGNISYLKLNATAVVEFDYSSAVVDGKTLDGYLQSRGEDFVRDWPNDETKAAEYFIVRINQKNKKGGMQATRPGHPAQYKILIKVTSLDMGNGGSTFIPMAGAKAGGVIMNGTVEIIDLSTGQTECTVRVDEIKGTGHVSETVRLGLCYFELANNLTKLADKSGPAPAVTVQAPVATTAAPSQSQPAKAAPKSAAPKQEPAAPAAETKPAQTAPAKSEPAKSEPAKTAPAQTAPAKAAPKTQADGSGWDVIICSGEDIKCKVIKVGQKEIEYKKAGNIDGPTYTISRNKAEKIIYANGTEEDVKISTFDFLKKKK